MKKNRNNKKKENRNQTYELLYQTSYMLFLLLGCLLLLYMHDGYYDLMESKAQCFSLTVKILLPFLLLTLFFKWKKRRLPKLGSFEIGLLVFLSVACISMFLSSSIKDSFSGELGWYVGFFAIFSLIFIYFVFQGETFQYRYMYIPLFLISIFEYAVTILDCARLDVLHLREVISGSDYYNFYGTIGNCNWYVGFLSLTVVFFVCMYLGCENRKQRIAYFIASWLGLIASVLNGADGIYLAFGFCSFFALPLALKNPESVKRLAVLAFSFFVSLLLVGVIPAFSDRISCLNGFGKLFFHPLLCILMIVISGIFVFLIPRIKKEFYEKNRRMIIQILESILIVTVLAFTVYLIGHMDEDFGGGRMMLWKLSFSAYGKEYTPLMKLFGVGPEMLLNVYRGLSNDRGAIYNAAHSEAIQLLLTTGISGLLAWLFCWGNLFVRYFREYRLNDHKRMAISACLFAYFGQSFVNSATTVNLNALLFFVLLLSQKDSKKNQKN